MTVENGRQTHTVDGDSDGPGWSTVVIDGRSYRRRPIRTEWQHPGDDLTALLRSCRERQPSDTIAVSEKVAVLLTFRTVPVDKVRVTPLTRLLARSVHPRPDELGLALPAKMQYVIDRVGRGRVYAAAALSAVTRPLGVHGIFYRVAGSLARDVDGGRPPYEDRFFPPLPELEAALLCQDLENLLGVGVAIVDINDFGGSVRATSPSAVAAAALVQILSDNPMGQRFTAKPLVLIRPVADSPAPMV